MICQVNLNITCWKYQASFFLQRNETTRKLFYTGMQPLHSLNNKDVVYIQFYYGEKTVQPSKHLRRLHETILYTAIALLNNYVHIKLWNAYKQ